MPISFFNWIVSLLMLGLIPAWHAISEKEPGFDHHYSIKASARKKQQDDLFKASANDKTVVKNKKAEKRKKTKSVIYSANTYSTSQPIFRCEKLQSKYSSLLIADNLNALYPFHGFW